MENTPPHLLLAGIIGIGDAGFALATISLSSPHSKVNALATEDSPAAFVRILVNGIDGICVTVGIRDRNHTIASAVHNSATIARKVHCIKWSLPCVFQSIVAWLA